MVLRDISKYSAMPLRYSAVVLRIIQCYFTIFHETSWYFTRTPWYSAILLDISYLILFHDYPCTQR